MKLIIEDQILDEGFRARVIKDIKSESNNARKNEAKKRYEVYKDNTVKYVMAKLQRELKDVNTLAIMENRAANISIGKKVINKLGRVYACPVTRETGSETVNNQIAELAKIMNFDQNQKKADRLTRLQKNTLVWFYPDAVGADEYRICQKVYQPWQYDVLENPNDPERPACVVFSDFNDSRQLGLPLGEGPQVSALEGTTSVSSHGMTLATNSSMAINTDETRTYIWWTNNYHFTTDSKGKILRAISPEGLENPIGRIPGVTVAEDQDGEYWAQGGQDLIDGAILVNTLITDMFAIAFMQGWGQLVITGDKVPEEYVMGPHHALVLRYDSKAGEAKPEVDVINANPPLADWMRSIEQYVALLLSTNNLSPTTVASKLDVSAFPSGVALLVDRSESTDSIEDKEQDFYWAELAEWEVIKRYHNLYYDRKLLAPEFADVGRIPDETRVTPKFGERNAEVVTESERLDNMKKRRELGVASQIDLIMQDNPGMSKDEAMKKLLDIKKDEVESIGREMQNQIKNMQGLKNGTKSTDDDGSDDKDGNADDKEDGEDA
jgi:hypothetical protein